MRKLIVRSVICLIVISIAYLVFNNPFSIIPDRGMERAIREQIGKPDGVITPEDCRGITELDLSFSDWNTSLEGLQYFVDLEILRSSAGRLSNISALSELTQLRELTLYLNNISNLTPLSGLASLERLDITGNKVRDLSPLASLTNLKYLIIGQNPAGDIYSTPERLSIASFVDYGRVRYIPASFAPLAHLEGLQIGAWADYDITVKDGSFVDTNTLPDEEIHNQPEEIEEDIIP